MEFRRIGDRYIVRLDVGEEINMTLKKFCDDQGITSGKVMGIGVMRQARISYFDIEMLDYIHKDISDYVEVTSLMGNISIMDGEVFPHLHVTISDVNFNVLGGHLSSGVIGVTGEIIIDTFEGRIERKLYQETGFRLLALEEDD
jgi:hypothetical protein